MKLSHAVPGQRAVIASVAEGPVGARLESVGFVPGTVVEVCRRAPLGDPTLYVVRGTQMALRAETAELIDVEPAESIDQPEALGLRGRHGE